MAIHHPTCPNPTHAIGDEVKLNMATGFLSSRVISLVESLLEYRLLPSYLRFLWLILFFASEQFDSLISDDAAI